MLWICFPNGFTLQMKRYRSLEYRPIPISISILIQCFYVSLFIQTKIIFQIQFPTSDPSFVFAGTSLDTDPCVSDRCHLWFSDWYFLTLLYIIRDKSWHLLIPDQITIHSVYLGNATAQLVCRNVCGTCVGLRLTGVGMAWLSWEQAVVGLVQLHPAPALNQPEPRGNPADQVAFDHGWGA